MPLVELMVLTGFVDVCQNLVVQQHRPLLVIRARQKLDELPPVDLVAGLKELLAVIIQDVYCPKKKIIGHVVIVSGQLFDVFMAEIIHVKLLRMNLMHRGAGIRYRTYFVGIEFFPINGLSFTVVLCVFIMQSHSTLIVPVNHHQFSILIEYILGFWICFPFCYKTFNLLLVCFYFVISWQIFYFFLLLMLAQCFLHNY